MSERSEDRASNPLPAWVLVKLVDFLRRGASGEVVLRVDHGRIRRASMTEFVEGKGHELEGAPRKS